VAHGIEHLASLNHFHVAHVRRILPFARLGSSAIEAILNGQIAPDLRLDSLLGRIPMAWKEQAAILGSSPRIVEKHYSNGSARDNSRPTPP